MSDVVYLHVDPRGEDATGPGASYPVIPVGVVGLCNMLVTAGFSVRGLNVPVERLHQPGFRLDTWLAQTPAPALVLLDLHWAEHALGVVDAIPRVATAWPGARILVGGLTATRFADELLTLCPDLDGVLRGDAEAPVLSLATALSAGEKWRCNIPNLVTRTDSGEIVTSVDYYRTSQADYDGLDTVDLSWLDHAESYRRLLHSRPPRGPGRADWTGHWLANGRGCAFECLYCGGSRSAHEQLSGRKGLLRRDPVALAADVTRLVTLGVDQVALTLDPDMLGPQHREPFFAALRDAPGFYVESFQLLGDPLLDALARHADPNHTEIALTPLSGARAVRRRNGKHYDNDALITRLDAIFARDLSAFVFFSMNLPGEDNATFQETLALGRTLLDRAPPGRLRVMNICHTLDPGSPMSERPADFGVGELHFRTLSDWVQYGRQPRPWRFGEGERGFSMPGRDLRRMVAEWDGFCEDYAGYAIPVPGV